MIAKEIIMHSIAIKLVYLAAFLLDYHLSTALTNFTQYSLAVPTSSLWTN